MEKKLHVRKAIAVCLMLVFTWLAVCSESLDCVLPVSHMGRERDAEQD